MLICGHCGSKFVAKTPQAAWTQFAFHMAVIHCPDIYLGCPWEWTYIRKATKPMTELTVTQCWN